MPIKNLVSKLYTSGVNAYKSHAINEREISIELDDSKPCYTSGDIVKGRVIINFMDDITVTGIYVKLKCDIGTRVIYDEHKSSAILEAGDEGRIRKGHVRVSASKRQIYRRDVKVFPPEDLKESNSKSYTIASGKHVYEFSLQFPGVSPDEPAVPPSYTQGTFNDNFYFYCEHSIKVTVKRASSFTTDPRLEKTLAFVPLLDQREMESSPMTTISDIFDLDNNFRVDAQALFPKYGLPQAPFPIPLQLAVKSHGKPIVVQNVYLTLNRITRWNSRDIKRQKFTMQDQKSVIIGKIPINQSGSTIDLSDSMQNLTISEYTIPSFKQDLLEVTYELVIGISISLDGSTFGTKMVELKGPTTVLPPALSNTFLKPTVDATIPHPPPVLDSKSEAEYIKDLKSSQNERPYLPAYQE